MFEKIISFKLVFKKIAFKKIIILALCWGQIFNPSLLKAMMNEDQDISTISTRTAFKALVKTHNTGSPFIHSYCHAVNKNDEGIYRVAFDSSLHHENLSLFLTDKDQVVGALTYTKGMLHFSGLEDHNFSLETIGLEEGNLISYAYPQFIANVLGYLTLKNGDFSQGAFLKSRKLYLKGNNKVQADLVLEASEEAHLEDLITAKNVLTQGTKCIVSGILLAENSHFLFPHSGHVRAGEDVMADAVKLRSTGYAHKIEDKEGLVTVTTDHNAFASYQLESERFPVKEDKKIQLLYKIAVNPGGKIAFGLLNTNRDQWYEQERTLGPGRHEGVYEVTVPEGETEASFVLRNDHLGVAGQSTFTIEKLALQKVRIVKPHEDVMAGLVKLKSTGSAHKIEEEDGLITVITDYNSVASYQLMSERFPVEEGQKLRIPYKITVRSGGSKYPKQ